MKRTLLIFVVLALLLAACQAAPTEAPPEPIDYSAGEQAPLQEPQSPQEPEPPRPVDIDVTEQQGQGYASHQESTVSNLDVIVAAGQFGSFAVQPDGSLYGWGIWGDIKWDMDMSLPPLRPIPERIMDGVVSVTAGGWHDSTVMILQADGSLWALGSNPHGQFGDGTTTSRDEPVRVMDDVADVSVGGFHTMVIKTDGSLWTFGGNWHGQLGDRTTIDRHTPIRIMEDVIAVSAGASHSMAITSDGVLWGWGHNGTGRLGYAPTADELNPIHSRPIRIMDNVTHVSAGHDHTLAIRTDNSVWAFGNNTVGTLGVGSPIIPPEGPLHLTASPSPTPMRVLSDVVAISAGNRYSMAITSDGVLWGWGFNEGWVRLGLGDRARDEYLIYVTTPTAIMDNVVSVSAWSSHILATRTDDSVWAWGDNFWGQIGDGGIYGFPEDSTMAMRSSPVRVDFPTR